MQTKQDPAADSSTGVSFPRLEALDVRMPLESKDWTIWPRASESHWDYVRGFPLELHPFAWDYLVASCDCRRVELKPHYLESSFDTFWIDTSGHVTCHALAGLFPFTLGRQPELLEGLRKTLEAVAARVQPDDPDAAKTIREIAAQLDALVLALREIPKEVLQRELEEEWSRARTTRRGRAAEAFWLAKRARNQRRRSP